jgi:glycine/D-amino acid oxidase-like deaminating enzyme
MPPFLVSNGEGWFDPWLLLCHLKNKASDMGVHLIEGEIHNINMNNDRILGVKVTI